MESIASESMSFRMLRCLALVAMVIVGLSGCSQTGTAQHPMLARPKVFEAYEKYELRFEGDNSFKVFALANDGAWTWRMRPTLDAAIEETMTECAMYTNLSGCRLFAVGNTIVWDMPEEEQKMVLAKYESKKTELNIANAPLSSGAIYMFNNDYKREDDCERYKVFVMSENGAWNFTTRPTFEEAQSDAIALCDFHAGRRRLCHLFAVGDIVVWDMSEEARAEVIKDYKQRGPCN